MLSTPGIAGVRNIQAQRSPELQMVLDRDRMKDLGLSSSAVGQALRMAVSGSQVSTFRVEGQPELDLTLDRERTDPWRHRRAGTAAADLHVEQHTPVRVSQVAKLSNAEGAVSDHPVQPRAYDHGVRQPGPGSGSGRSQLPLSCKVFEENVVFPDGYRIPESGMIKMMTESFASLFQALALSIVLIYMLMVALYESLVSPFAIMFSLPVSLVGAFLGLAVTGNTLNIFSILGLIMLMGLVTKNGILIVDFADILRQRGVSRTEALVQAGKQRMRPDLDDFSGYHLRDDSAGAQTGSRCRITRAAGCSGDRRNVDLDAVVTRGHPDSLFISRWSGDVRARQDSCMDSHDLHRSSADADRTSFIGAGRADGTLTVFGSAGGSMMR